MRAKPYGDMFNQLQAVRKEILDFPAGTVLNESTKARWMGELGKVFVVRN